jgi:hypothetical protein
VASGATEVEVLDRLDRELLAQRLAASNIVDNTLVGKEG